MNHPNPNDESSSSSTSNGSIPTMNPSDAASASYPQSRSAFTSLLLSELASINEQREIHDGTINSFERAVMMMKQDSQRAVEDSLLDLNHTDDSSLGWDLIIRFIYVHALIQSSIQTQQKERMMTEMESIVWTHLLQLLLPSRQSTPTGSSSDGNVDDVSSRYDVSRLDQFGRSTLHHICEWKVTQEICALSTA